MVLQQIVKILQQADQIVAALTEVQLPEWKRRQQGACIGGPFDTCLDYLQKWLEVPQHCLGNLSLPYMLHVMTKEFVFSACRFTAVAEVLMQVRQELQKLQEQNQKYNSPNTSGLYQETEKSALLLLRKLLAK